jgi:AcrR family transcriptional regulator
MSIRLTEMPGKPYHHGDLREALLRSAVDCIEEGGALSMTMREVARRAGVTHPAATYHFGDKAGLLTSVATEGYRMLGEVLEVAQRAQGSFLEVGVAYVRFAVTHRAHFEVMYQPDLLHTGDPALLAARATTAALLYGSGDVDTERMVAGVAAWSIVHGLATLWIAGNIPGELGDDPEAITRIVASRLQVGKR